MWVEKIITKMIKFAIFVMVSIYIPTELEKEMEYFTEVFPGLYLSNITINGS